MRRKFEETLHRYRDNINEQFDAEVQKDTVQIDRLAVAADVELERRAKSVGVSKEVQQEIFDLQKEKQRLMDELKKTLRIIDGKEQDYEFKPQTFERVVAYDAERNIFRVGEGEDQEDATLGEVLFDGDFGVSYAVNFADDTIPRPARKQFIVEKTKRKLRSLLDRQILHEEIARPDQESKKSYESFFDPENQSQPGKLAELVVGYFLKRLEVDTQIPFRFEIADVHQDVSQKIDFIIRRQDYRRGIETTSDSQEVIGVQFTMQTSKREKKHKQEQISHIKASKAVERVDDIVLISLPIKHVKTIFYQWEERQQATKKTAGGPVAFLLDKEKEYLVRGIFKDFLSAEELDDFVQKSQTLYELDRQRVQEEEARIKKSWRRRRYKSPGRIKHEEHLKALKEKRRSKQIWKDFDEFVAKLRKDKKTLHYERVEALKVAREQGLSKKERREVVNKYEQRLEELKDRMEALQDIVTVKKEKRTRDHERLVREMIKQSR